MHGRHSDRILAGLVLGNGDGVGGDERPVGGARIIGLDGASEHVVEDDRRLAQLVDVAPKGFELARSQCMHVTRAMALDCEQFDDLGEGESCLAEQVDRRKPFENVGPEEPGTASPPRRGYKAELLVVPERRRGYASTARHLSNSEDLAVRH